MTLVASGCEQRAGAPAAGDGGAEPVAELPLTATPLPATIANRLIYILDLDSLVGARLSRLLAVNPDTAAVAFTLETRYGAAVALAPDGRRLYIADTYFTQVTRGEQRDVLSMYDALTGELLTDDRPVPGRALPLGVPPDQFLFLSGDGAQLFMQKYGDPPDYGDIKLAILDTETLQITQERRWPPACGLIWAAAGRWLCTDNQHLTWVDPETGSTLDTIVSFEDRFIRGHALAADSTKVYLFTESAPPATPQPPLVHAVDLSTHTITAEVQLAVPAGRERIWRHVALSPDGRQLVLGFVKADNNQGWLSDQLWVYDTATWEQVAVITPADPLADFAFSAEGDLFYAVSPLGRSLTILETKHFTTLATLEALGNYPAKIIAR